MNNWLRFVFVCIAIIIIGYLGFASKIRHHETSAQRSSTRGIAGKNSGSSVAPLAEDPHAVFGLVSASEGTLDDSPALTLNFSLPLDRRISYASQIDVFQMTVPVQPTNAAEPDEAQQNDDVANTMTNNPAVSTKPADLDTRGGQRVAGAWVVGDNPHILQFPHVLPDTRYVVVVRGALRSPGGKLLGAGISYSITTRSMNPAQYFASNGMALPSHQNGGLPVVTVNVPEVDVEFLRVKPSQLPRFLDTVVHMVKPHANAAGTDDDDAAAQDNTGSRRLKLHGAVYSWDLDSLQSMTDSVYHGRFLTDARKNRRNVTFLPVESIRELSKPGIYVAVMNQPGHFDYNRQTTYFYVTDLGLSLKQFDRVADVYVSSLTDAQAISDVAVSWLDRQGRVLATQHTDASGHAEFASRPPSAWGLMAQHADQIAIIPLHEPALDLSEYPVTGNLWRPVRLFAYSGRDLYRPGETFRVSAFMRDADGQPVQAQPVQAILRRADGRNQFIATLKPSPGLTGFYQQDIELPVDAPTGMWTLQLRTDPQDPTPAGEMQFHVEEFVPEKMKMDLSSNQTELNFGASFDISVHGSYLFGAPAADNRLITDGSIMPNHNPLPDRLPGFFFGDVDAHPITVKSPDETTLDDQGASQVSIDLPPEKNIQTPYDVKATFSLLESGGRPLVAAIQRTIWPADTLIGIRPLFTGTVDENSLANFEIACINRNGSLKTVSGLQMRLIRENRDWYWRFNGRMWDNGFTQTDELVDTRTLSIPASGKSRLGVQVIYGTYRLELIDPVTHLTTRYRFTAGWGWDMNGNGDQQDAIQRPDKVGLMLDRSGYHNGDIAKLTVNSPHNGPAIVTVDGDRVLWSERINIDHNNQQIDIPISKDWKRHDLYVTVTVLRPSTDGDLITPTRALGLIPLPLARTDRKLAVNLAAPDKVEPETLVPVTVRVTGSRNQPAVLTLSAVDTGILNITRFATPDPWQFFYGQLRYGADIHDIYGRLIEKMAGLAGKLKFGGDAPSTHPSMHTPQKVQLVDLYSGPVQLDARGEATVMVRLPDFNGKLRLMAVVASGDRFGSGERDMIVAAPLIAELNTPRFVAFGDQATLALDLHNLSGKTQNLHIVLKGDDVLGIADGSRSVHLANLNKTVLQFGLQVGHQPGLHHLHVSVEGENIHVNRDFPLQVESPLPPRQFLTFYKVAAGQTVRFDKNHADSLYPGTINGHLLVSDHVPLDVNTVVNGLLVYPYGCVEQTTSTTYPWLYVDETMAHRYHLKLYSMQARAQQVDRSMSKLAALQSTDGGFSLWGGNRDVEPWLSAYVTSFMQDAREQNFSVPETMYHKSLDYLLRDLQSSTSTVLSGRTPAVKDYTPEHGYDTLAYEGFVLARANRAPLATLREIFDQRSKMQTQLGKVYLGLALKLMGDNERATVAFHDAVKTESGNYRWSWDYGGNLRDDAESYALVSRYKVNLPQAEVWLMRVADQLRGHEYFWLDTQEQLSILLAARSEDTNSLGKWRATLELANKSSEQNGIGTQVIGLNDADIGKVSLTNRSNGILYVTETINGSPKTQSVSSEDYRLERTLYQPDGTKINDRPLKVGETVIVRLQVYGTQGYTSRTTLVVDQVPAGLEIENLNLVKDSRLGEVKFDGHDAENDMHNPNITHVEYRDDRFVASIRIGTEYWFNQAADLFYQARVVTPGRFVMPGTHVEDMYNPSFSDDEPSGIQHIVNGQVSSKPLKSEADTPAGQ